MGINNSRHCSGGSLEGAYTSGLLAAPENQPTIPAKSKKFKVRVPYDKRGGQKMHVFVRDKTVQITIPSGLKPGHTFLYTIAAETEKVYASTLPSIPGLTVLQSKPIIWGSVCYTVQSNDMIYGASKMGVVGKMMQQAQSQILEQAVEHECNAVLGLSFNTSGVSNGAFKQLIVTCCGTPCVVATSTTKEVPVVTDVIVEPLYSVATPVVPVEEDLLEYSR